MQWFAEVSDRFHRNIYDEFQYRDLIRMFSGHANLDNLKEFARIINNKKERNDDTFNNSDATSYDVFNSSP